MIKDYEGFLIDLDGTTYFGANRIPTAESFIKLAVKKNVPILFVTNNATQTVEQIAHKLQTHYDLPVDGGMVYTSTLALIEYLKHHCVGKSVYVVGEEALHQQIDEAGFRIDQTPNAEVVVQGLNRHATYEELAGAVKAILNGADFLVTNNDRLLPTATGLTPSSGALTAFITYASRKEPIIMGKPYAPVIDGAVNHIDIPAEKLLLIGDNYDTDIKAGIDAGIDTLLVLTGVTSADEVENLPVPPTYVLDDLSQWSRLND